MRTRRRRARRLKEKLQQLRHRPHTHNPSLHFLNESWEILQAFCGNYFDSWVFIDCHSIERFFQCGLWCDLFVLGGVGGTRQSFQQKEKALRQGGIFPSMLCSVPYLLYRCIVCFAGCVFASSRLFVQLLMMMMMMNHKLHLPEYLVTLEVVVAGVGVVSMHSCWH